MKRETFLNELAAYVEGHAGWLALTLNDKLVIMHNKHKMRVVSTYQEAKAILTKGE